MSDQSIENKQKYLRDHILDQGFDAEDFMGFCEQTLGEIDLQGWAFSKLQQVVQKFINGKKITTHTQQELDNDEWTDFTGPVGGPIQEKSQNLNIQEFSQKVQAKKQLIFSESDWSIFGFDFPQKQVSKNKPQNIIQQHSLSSDYPKINMPMYQNKQLTTKPPIQLSADSKPSKANKKQGSIGNLGENKEQKADFAGLKVQQVQQALGSKKKICQIGEIKVSAIKSKQLGPLPAINDITVVKTQQKGRNFLQGDYTLYHIKFSPCNHLIERKFNDFRKLRAILHKLYPQIRLPYLEPEGWLVNSSEGKDPETLNKYKYMVVEFLKYVTMRNETLKKSKIVRIFVGLMDSTPLDFKKYENTAKPKIFKQLCVLKGQISLPRYQCLFPIDKYMSGTNSLLGDVDYQYEKLKKSLQTLFYNYDQLGKSLTEVSGIFDSLENLIQKFNFDNDSRKELRVYEGIKQVCLKMKENVNEQHSIFKNKIQTLFKYERENMNTIKETNEIRNRMFAEYVKQGLQEKKWSLASSHKNGPVLVQGNMSIEDPSRSNKNQLVVQNMFWAHHTLENIEQYWSQLRFKINELLTLVAYDELDSENANLNFWNNVIKKCVI